MIFANPIIPTQHQVIIHAPESASNTPGGKCTMDAALIFIAVAWGLSRNTNTRQKGAMSWFY